MQQDFQIVFEHHGDHMPGLPIGISTVNPDGSDMRLLRQTGSTPAWSCDGKWIAFVDVPPGYDGYATNIFIMRPEGSQVTQVTFHKDNAACRPRWSPDSKTLLYSLWTGERYHVFATQVGSGRMQQITRDGSLAYPEWTADGDIVALDRSDSPSKVVILAPNGDNPRTCTLFQAGDEEMVWSPDGRKIAFVRYGSLCVMNADGTGLQESKYGGPGKAGVLSIAWRPDCEGLVFSAEIRDDAGKEVFLFDLASGKERPIVCNPCWHATGDQKKYAEIIDVSCSPVLDAPKSRGLLGRLFTKRS
jgi:Tol biopolymer transport system component